MGSVWLIAALVTASFALSFAQPASAQAKHSAQVPALGDSAPSEDQAFAGYQRVTAGITPPKATHSPDPQYPDVPADTEPRGVVVMLIGVNSHGHVGPVLVVRSSAPVFEKSAVATVKSWRFKPAKKDGKPVPVQITVEMSFAK